MDHRLRPLLDRIVAKPLPWFLPAVAIFLYLRVFIPPFTPVYFGDDQAYFLTYAGRMLDGQLIYRDFFQFTPPGTSLVYFALFKAFGCRAWIPNLAILLLGVGLVWLTVSIAGRIVSAADALLAGLLFLTFVYVNILDATHHRYSMFAVAAAIAVVIETRTPRRVAWAGMLCGAASFFTLSRGLVAVLGLGIFLVWESWETRQGWGWVIRRETGLCLAFAGTLGLANAYFIGKAGLARVVYCQLIFFLKYLPVTGYYMVALPEVPPWHNLPKLAIFLFVHALIPLVYLLFFVRYFQTAKSRPAEPWGRLMLVSITGLALFLEVSSAVNWIRLFGVALPALVVFVWFARGRNRMHRAIVRSLWAVALILTIAEPGQTQRHWRACLNLPSGRTAFLDPSAYQQFSWLSERTHVSDYFFQGPAAGFYFPLGLRDPA